MNYSYKGMVAGAAAAFVLAGFLLLNRETGFLPELDFVSLLGGLTGTGTIGGWLFHFMIGALWGALFAWLDPDLPGDGLRQRGIVFALAAWFVMMFALMPLAGFGFFGLNYGVLLPVAALALHLAFGAVMGGTYGWLILQAMPLRYRQPRASSARRPSLSTRIESRPAVAAASPAPAKKVGLPTVQSPPAIPLAPSNARPATKLKKSKTLPRRSAGETPATMAESNP